METFLFCLFSYLCGSIPFGWLISKYFIKIDIRSIGSGNIGATNVLRTGKKIYAFLTVLCDILKGTIPILMVNHHHKPIIAFCAVIGHIFPVWLHFKGGKGVATALGCYLALWPTLGLGLFAFWIIISKIRKQSSFSSLITLAAGAILSLPYSFWGFYIFLIILWKHKENLKRLWKNEEPYL